VISVALLLEGERIVFVAIKRAELEGVINFLQQNRSINKIAIEYQGHAFNVKPAHILIPYVYH